MENQFEKAAEYVRRKAKQPSTSFVRFETIQELTEPVLNDMKWLDQILDLRIHELQNKSQPSISFEELTPPELKEETPYTELIRKFQLNAPERLLLISSIVTQTVPEMFTHKLRHEDKQHKLKYTEPGGYIDAYFTHFIPSLQTMLFLLAGADNIKAIYYKNVITRNSILNKEGIIRFNTMRLGTDEHNELNHIPVLAQEYLNYVQTGEKPRPDFGTGFPATWVTTGLNWEHLVLNKQTLEQVEDIMRWVEYGTDMINLSDAFNPSYPCLFYGPPGTGKSLTAKLIGKKYNKDVFRIDLSMVVSKYIGETEKNLALLFNRAQNKDWILFFDEADALFTKRTDVNSSNDKWANLEVSYLLQRIEEHRGLTILASNLRDNIDGAMTRRFQSVIYFPKPGVEERKALWKNLLPPPFSYSPSINISKLAQYDLSGANISNIIKDSSLTAMGQQTYIIEPSWLSKSISKEFIKEKRTP